MKRTAKELEQALGNAMIAGSSYIGRDRDRCDREHRDALDKLTAQLDAARSRENS